MTLTRLLPFSAAEQCMLAAVQSVRNVDDECNDDDGDDDVEAEAEACDWTAERASERTNERLRYRLCVVVQCNHAG